MIIYKYIILIIEQTIKIKIKNKFLLIKFATAENQSFRNCTLHWETGIFNRIIKIALPFA